MKFTTGAMVGDLSGSIGSTTASRNKFGQYFRSKVIPVNPNTTRQQTVRAFFATLVSAWNDALTPAQRTAWNLWAQNTTIQGKDGNPINITGQNAYIRFNTARLQVGGTRVDSGPIVFNNGNPITGFQSTVLTQVSEIGQIAGLFSTDAIISGGASDAGDLAVFLGGPVNASRNFFKGPYQFSTTEAVTQSATSVPITATAQDQEQAIDLDALQYRSIRFRMIYDDGRISEKFEALANVIEDAV